jgi:hypothetical protein
MFKVVYEVRHDSHQHIDTVLVCATNFAEARLAVERSNYGCSMLWHISCDKVEAGEIYLVKQE